MNGVVVDSSTFVICSVVTGFTIVIITSIYSSLNTREPELKTTP